MSPAGAVQNAGFQKDAVLEKPQSEIRTITVAVAGNPNSEKSTLINALAGTRLQVGNWPGVTVEKKEALFEFEGKRIKLVDLPGTYSLSPYTQEEIITREYLIAEKPDLIINVVDATNLERNLYLTIQLLELGIPVVLALNMYDEARSKGYLFRIPVMEALLGVKVVPTVSTKGEGLKELMEAIVDGASAPKAVRLPKQLVYSEDIETAVAEIEHAITKAHPSLVPRFPLRWLAYKIMESDERVLKEVNAPEGIPDTKAMQHLRSVEGDDIESLLADARHGLAGGFTREVLTKPEIQKREVTERIDRIVLSRVFGIPIFLAVMWLAFKLTFDLSTPFADWIDAITQGPFKRWTEALFGFLGASDWMVSLATDGVIAGVGFVFVFIPVIFAMMFFITFLEGSGYMARAAFVMDRAMHAIGLHGKSFIPMLLGFGCNVPAIYATRTLENQRDKVLTALLIPLMSCGARLPVYVLFAAAFFPGSAGTVLWSLYVLGIVLAIMMGLLFKKTLFRGDAPPFIMELPPYRLPTLRNLASHTWEKGKHFVIKAGTYILAVSILVWFLLNLPWGVEQKKDSYLGRAGQVLAPVFEPLGFGNWQAASSLITGVVAKEIVVGTMGEIYVQKKEEPKEKPGLAEDAKEIGLSFFSATKDAASNVASTFGIASIKAEEDEKNSRLKDVIQNAFSPLSAYAFMVFVLLYMPCVIVAIAMRQEFGTWKWFGIAFVYQMILAWSAAAIVYQGGELLELGG